MKVFLVLLFTRDVLAMKKLEIKKKVHFYYISFKSLTLGGLSFFDFQLLY